MKDCNEALGCIRHFVKTHPERHPEQQKSLRHVEKNMLWIESSPILQVRTPISLAGKKWNTDRPMSWYTQSSGYIQRLSHGSLYTSVIFGTCHPELAELSCTPWPLNVWMNACEAHPPRHPEDCTRTMVETACRADSRWLIITTVYTKKYLARFQQVQYLPGTNAYIIGSLQIWYIILYPHPSTNSAIQISSPPVAAPHQPSRIGNQQMDANGTRAFMFCLIMFGQMLRAQDALAKVAYLILAWLRKTKYSWTYLPTHAIWQSQVAVCHNWPNNSNLIILWLLPVSVARRPLIFRVFFLWPTIRVLNPSFSCLPEKLFSEIPQRFDMVWQAFRTMTIQGVLGADLLFFGPLIVIFMMPSSMVMLFVPVVVMSLVRMQTLYYICSLSLEGRVFSVNCLL